jgi:cation/acetate symporter
VNTTAFIMFLGIVAITLGITYWASKQTKTAGGHFVAGGGINGWQNGLAISGDYVSAASFLGISGAIALSGYNGFYLAVGVPIAYLLVLLIVAEPLRNLGRYTMADMIAVRFPRPQVRGAVAINTLIISLVYMIVQFVGAGALVQLLLGIPYPIAVTIIGVLMIIYTLFGGMLATTWIQITKTVLLLTGAILLLILVIRAHGWNPGALFADAVSLVGPETVQPQRASFVAGLDTLSLELGLVLGVMGLPHVMIRFLTVPNAKAARLSAVVALWIFSVFYLLLPLIGYGALLELGRDTILAANPAGNLAAPQLAEELGGALLLAFIAAVAFSTILAVLSGIIIASSGAFAHDLYSNILRKGDISDKEELKAARIASVGIAAVALVLALGARNFNLAFMANLAFAIAASANLPTILFSIYWRRFNHTGAMWSMVGGITSAVVLVILSPNIMGDGAIFPLTIPALVSVPIGFLCAWIGTLVGERSHPRTDEDDRVFDAVVTRSLVGNVSGQAQPMHH